MALEIVLRSKSMMDRSSLLFLSPPRRVPHNWHQRGRSFLFHPICLVLHRARILTARVNGRVINERERAESRTRRKTYPHLPRRAQRGGARSSGAQHPAAVLVRGSRALSRNEREWNGMARRSDLSAATGIYYATVRH